MSAFLSISANVAMLDNTIERTGIRELLDEIGVGNRIGAAQAVFVVSNAELEFETLSSSVKEIGKRKRVGAAADCNDNLIADI